MRVRFQRGSPRGGFTIIEVIVALVVVGLLVAGFMAAGMDTTGASVVGAADTLRAHLGFAQSLAMANNVADWSVVFVSGSYALLRDNSPSPIPWPGETNVPPYVHRLPLGVNVAAGVGAVVFDEFGAPAADYPIQLSNGAHSEGILITGFTGFVQ